MTPEDRDPGPAPTLRYLTVGAALVLLFVSEVALAWFLRGTL